MDFKEIAGNINTPIGVFDLSGKGLIVSLFFEEILKIYGDVYTLLGIESEDSAFFNGIVVEKPLFVEGDKKVFSFYVQRTKDVLFVVGVDTTYNFDLVNEVIERSGFITKILSEANVGIFVLDFEGNYLYKNISYERFENEFNYTCEEFLNKLLEEDEVVEVEPVFFNRGERYILRYGRVAEYRGERCIKGFVLFDDFFSDFLNMIKKENDVLSEILKNFPEGIIYLTKDNLELKYYNKTAESILGNKRIDGIKALGFFEPDIVFDRDTLDLIIEGLSRNNNFEVFNYKLPNEEGEFDFYFISSESSIIVLFKKIVPVKERKAYLQFRTMFEYASDAIFLVKDYRFVECNKKAEEVFGCSKDEIIGKTPSFFSPEFQSDGMPSEEASLKMIDSATLKGSRVFEWVHKRCDGSLFFAEVTLSKIQIGGYTYTQAIVRDISSRKNLIEFGRGLLTMLASEMPVFIFDNRFNVVVQNNVKSELTVEDVKRFVISVLTKINLVKSGVYSRKVEIDNSEYLLNVKILKNNDSKYFLVTFKKN